MAISYVDIGTAGTVGTANSLTQTATMPTTFAAFDLLLCFVDRTNDYVLTSATPTGWTFLRSTFDVTATPAAAGSDIFWRIAAGGDAAPTFTVGTTTKWLVHTVAYRGTHQTSPFIVENAQAEAGAATTTVHSAPALTNTDNNAWGVFHITYRQVATPSTVTPGTGLTERADTENANATAVNETSQTCDTNGVVAASTVTYTATSSAGTNAAVMWAAFLAPAPASTIIPTRPQNVARFRAANW